MSKSLEELEAENRRLRDALDRQQARKATEYSNFDGRDRGGRSCSVCGVPYYADSGGGSIDWIADCECDKASWEYWSRERR